jgi:hypothetical protein
MYLSQRKFVWIQYGTWYFVGLWIDPEKYNSVWLLFNVYLDCHLIIRGKLRIYLNTTVLGMTGAVTSNLCIRHRPQFHLHQADVKYLVWN